MSKKRILKRILIVEDEEDIAETTKQIVETAGYKADIAKDGLEAIDKIYKKKYHLLLLDIVLPELNGYQICRILKSEAKYKDIPIIMLTAKTPRSNKFRGIETGADEYLTKPYDSNQLIKKIKELLKDV